MKKCWGTILCAVLLATTCATQVMGAVSDETPLLGTEGTRRVQVVGVNFLTEGSDFCGFTFGGIDKFLGENLDNLETSLGRKADILVRAAWNALNGTRDELEEDMSPKLTLDCWRNVKRQLTAVGKMTHNVTLQEVTSRGITSLRALADRYGSVEKGCCCLFSDIIHPNYQFMRPLLGLTDANIDRARGILREPVDVTRESSPSPEERFYEEVRVAGRGHARTPSQSSTGSAALEAQMALLATEDGQTFTTYLKELGQSTASIRMGDLLQPTDEDQLETANRKLDDAISQVRAQLGKLERDYKNKYGQVSFDGYGVSYPVNNDVLDHRARRLVSLLLARYKESPTTLSEQDSVFMTTMLFQNSYSTPDYRGVSTFIGDSNKAFEEGAPLYGKREALYLGLIPHSVEAKVYFAEWLAGIVMSPAAAATSD